MLSRLPVCCVHDYMLGPSVQVRSFSRCKVCSTGGPLVSVMGAYQQQQFEAVGGAKRAPVSGYLCPRFVTSLSLPGTRRLSPHSWPLR